MQILPCFIFLVLFSKKYGFIEKSSPSEKKIILKEELDCIDIDGIGNFEDSPRLVFIDGKCENLIVVSVGGELTGNIHQKKKSDIL